MSIFAFGSQFSRYTVLLLAVLNLFGFSAVALVGWVDASVENGPIEDVQLFALLVSLLAGVVSAYLAKGPLRSVMTTWAALMLLMLQREFDFGAYGTDSWIYQMRSDTVRLAFWMPVLLVLIALLARHTAPLLRAARSVRLIHLWPVVAVAAIMLGSNLCENLATDGSEWTNIFVFLEEQLELNAYGVIACMGVAFASRLLAPVPSAVADARNRLDPAA